MTDQESTTVIITEEEPKNTSPWLIAVIVGLGVLCCCCIGILIVSIFAGSLMIDVFDEIFNQLGFYYY